MRWTADIDYITKWEEYRLWADDLRARNRAAAERKEERLLRKKSIQPRSFVEFGKKIGE